MQKEFDRTQHPFTMKTLSTRNRRELPQLDKDYLQLTSYVMVRN